MKIVSTLTKWVIPFDPMEFMNTAEVTNLAGIDSVDESKFRDFTDDVLRDLQMSKREYLGLKRQGLFAKNNARNSIGKNEKLNQSLTQLDRVKRAKLV